MILALLLSGMAAAGAAAPVAQPAPLDDAIAYFQRLCVATMPKPAAFAAMLSQEPGWQAFRKIDGHIPVIGHFWRSERGELSYQNLPGMTETNPGCHYSFRTVSSYTHAQGVDALTKALALPAGKTTGGRKAPQTRWEAALPNGLRMRLFLTSERDPELGGEAARLSISAYPDTGRRN
jgi:hypothetical protein